MEKSPHILKGQITMDMLVALSFKHDYYSKKATRLGRLYPIHYGCASKPFGKKSLKQSLKLRLQQGTDTLCKVHVRFDGSLSDLHDATTTYFEGTIISRVS